MAEIEKKWYVLRAISGKEAKVKEMCIRDRYLCVMIERNIDFEASVCFDSREEGFGCPHHNICLLYTSGLGPG